jgi:tetratricopeptide (TPR) repeat protein
MENEPNSAISPRPGWSQGQLAVVCAVCLAVGLPVGYLLRDSRPAPVRARSTSKEVGAHQSPSQSGDESAAPAQTTQAMPHKMPSLSDLKRMADMKSAPLLQKLNADPKNPQLRNQIGLIYESAHQFKEAAGYFETALQYDPKNIGLRADYASCLFYTGDVDGALAQLNQSLTYDPKHAGTLMNIGIIKWKGKNDVDGAIAAWEKLLRYHPEFPQKDLVRHMISEAKLAGAKAS